MAYTFICDACGWMDSDPSGKSCDDCWAELCESCVKKDDGVVYCPDCHQSRLDDGELKSL